MGSSRSARMEVSSWWLVVILTSISGEERSPIRRMWMHLSPLDTRATWIGSSVTPGWKTESLWGSTTFTNRPSWPLSTFRPCAPPPSEKSTKCGPPAHEFLQHQFDVVTHGVQTNLVYPQCERPPELPTIGEVSAKSPSRSITFG